METLLVSLIILFKRIWISVSLLKAYIFSRDKLSILAIGDSWLNLTLFEFKTKFKRIDTVDHLKALKEFNVIDCAVPGYRLIDEVKFKLFRTALNNVNNMKYVVLFSFGGNDLTLEFERFVEGRGKKVHLNKTLLRKALRGAYLNYLGFYMEMFRLELKAMNFHAGRFIKEGLHFFLHGYDYFRPDLLLDGKRHDRFRKLYTVHMADDAQARRIAREFVDVTNQELKAFCATQRNMHYIDMRGRVAEDQWAEPIHPNASGFKALADRIAVEIRRYV